VKSAQTDRVRKVELRFESIQLFQSFGLWKSFGLEVRDQM